MHAVLHGAVAGAGIPRDRRVAAVVAYASNTGQALCGKPEA